MDEFPLVPDDEDLIVDSVDHAAAADDFSASGGPGAASTVLWIAQHGTEFFAALLAVLLSLNVVAWQLCRPVIERWRHS